MPAPSEVAESYYRLQAALSGSTAVAAQRLWDQIAAGDDFDEAWRTLGPKLFVLVSAGQRAAVDRASVFVPAVLDALNVDAEPVAVVRPSALAGVASDGRPLDTLLYQSIVRTRAAIGNGATVPEALEVGRNTVGKYAKVQVADAGRDAESVATAVRPKVTGYFRVLSLPSCERCAVLAGKFYAWNAGFARHPGCDCRHVPANRDASDELATNTLAAIRAGQVTGLSAADARAIADGADPFRVINAKRAMTTVGGLKATTALAKRGAVRLRPQAIYELAGGDRQAAIGLLEKYRYVTT